MDPVHIVDLPFEILTSICSYLPRRELKHARLTSKKLNQVASIFLFRILYLGAEERTFENTRGIANDPSLCHLVRILSHCPWRLKGHGSPLYKPLDIFNIWKTNILEPRLRTVDLSDIQLRYLFSRWREHIGHDLLAVVKEFDALVDIMSKLPALHGLQHEFLTTGELHANSGDVKSLWELSTRAEAEASDYVNQEIRQSNEFCDFWTFLEAAHVAGRQNDVTKLKASGLELNLWIAKREESIYTHMALPRLTTVDLEFERCRSMSKPHLRDLLEGAPLLDHLALCFNSLDFPNYRYCTNIRLSDITAKDHHWTSLRHLSLRHVATSDAEIRGFLKIHRNSLRSLELGDILLHPGDEELGMVEEPSTDFQELKSNEEVGSWLDMIEFLRTSLSLSRMKFRGILGNGRNEAWKVSEEFPDVLGEKLYADYLKPRIERYICMRGENPIRHVPRDQATAETRPMISELDNRGLPIPSIFEDDTWQMAVLELPRRHELNMEVMQSLFW
ncbi:hypothetical protein WAI453_001485 [Rhynchosporium graminicola]